MKALSHGTSMTATVSSYLMQCIVTNVVANEWVFDPFSASMRLSIDLKNNLMLLQKLMHRVKGLERGIIFVLSGCFVLFLSIYVFVYFFFVLMH